jgi:hypothetical protein
MGILVDLVPLVAPELLVLKVFKENRAPLDTPAVLAPLDLLDQSALLDLKENRVPLDTPVVLVLLAPSDQSALLATQAKLVKLDPLDQLAQLDRSVLRDESPTLLLRAIIKPSLSDALAAKME